MRAAVIDRYGPPEVFRVAEHPAPRCGPRDLLIEVRASSVNPIDTKIRKGGFRAVMRYHLPWVLGLDVSGVVREVGSKVRRFKVGDEVYASPTHRRSGCYGELVAIDERAVALKPRNISHQEAAGLPLVALTAWTSLVDKGKVRPGHKVLIVAGAGGVGSVAIQIAKALGCRVAATCSTKNVELLRSLGADEVIDYTQEKVEQRLQGYDLVVESLGMAERERALAVLRPGGHMACLHGGVPEHVLKHGPVLGLARAVLDDAAFVLRAFFRKRVIVSHPVRPIDGFRLGRITELVEAGKLKPLVHKVYPLAEIAAAHAESESGRARGKIIIDLTA